MPIINGQYVKLTEEDLTSILQTELKNEFGADIDLSESSVFSTVIEVLSIVLSENQEVDIQEVYESAFLETATGADLEKVVEILGIQRRDAIHATGVVRFTRDSVADKDYTIQQGTFVQTDDSEPIQFETSTSVKIEFYDGFEDGNTTEYSGDTANWSATSSQAFTGSWSVTSSTSGSRIFRDDLNTQIGDILSCRVRPASTAVGQVLFGTTDVDNTYVAEVDQSGTFSLISRVSGTPTTLTSEGGLTVTADEWHRVEIDWRLPDENTTSQIVATLYDESGTEVSQITTTDDTYTAGGFGFGSEAAAAVYFDNYSSRGVAVNVRASEGGTEGNLGANTLNVLPSVPAGVSTVSNPFPTGDSDYNDVDGNAYVVGRDEETDDELRERVRESVGAAGSSTVNAISSALKQLDGVISVLIFENKTEVDNTGSGGLPPHSFEAVIFGGNDAEIAETIFEKKAATARDYGGANGTAQSDTVTSDVTGQQFTINWSTPTEIAVDFTLDIVVDETYIGNVALRDRIVRFVGGNLSDGTTAIGLDAGQDVIISQVEDEIVGEDTGVIGIASVSTTPAITTDGNGLEVVDIGPNEVATTDANDGSITLNVTEV